MAKKFAETERKLIEILKGSLGKNISYKKENYQLVLVDKPTIPKGECKTDIYVRLEGNQNKEIKISVKQTNADFLENKIKYERAKEIFGENVDQILSDSINKIQKNFKEKPLIYITKKGRTESKVITLGWKFELTNKKSGELSELISLSDVQKIDVYSGINLPLSKRDAKVENEIINNAGVANTILIIDPKEIKVLTSQMIFDKLKDIETYSKKQNIYFACKALNYRVSKDKWDGDRPLGVYINYSLIERKIFSKLIFNKPLQKKGNEKGNIIRNILSNLNIDENNFSDIENYIQNKSIIYKG